MAKDSIAENYSEVLHDLDDLEGDVKKLVAPKRRPTKYLRDAKSSVVDSWRQVRKDGFGRDLYQPIDRDAESFEACGCEKKDAETFEACGCEVKEAESSSKNRGKVKLHYEGTYDDDEGNEEIDAKGFSWVNKADYIRFYDETAYDPCKCDVQGCLSCFLDETNGWADGFGSSVGMLWFGKDEHGKKWNYDGDLDLVYQYNAEAESFGASCNCETFDRSAWDSNRCATCGEMRDRYYGAESFEGDYDDDDYEREQRRISRAKDGFQCYRCNLWYDTKDEMNNCIKECKEYYTYNDAESFEATSDELDCPSCKATPSERLGEPLCSTCNSCFECCETLCEDESFEAQTKLTAFTRGKDWEGKPYTGQIFPDHLDLDPELADRNEDGKMASWERAIGNQVATGKARFKATRKKPNNNNKFTQRKTITAASSFLPFAIAVGALATIVGLKGKK